MSATSLSLRPARVAKGATNPRVNANPGMTARLDPDPVRVLRLFNERHAALATAIVRLEARGAQMMPHATVSSTHDGRTDAAQLRFPSHGPGCERRARGRAAPGRARLFAGP